MQADQLMSFEPKNQQKDQKGQHATNHGTDPESDDLRSKVV